MTTTTATTGPLPTRVMPAVAAAPAAPARRVSAEVTDRALATRYRLQTVRRHAAADLLAVGAWTSVAAAIALFLSVGGAAKFTSLASSVTQLGIIAGLVAMDLCVLMFLTAARIPFVDRAIGHDRALAVHRKLGQGTVIGLAVHGLLLIVGYALTLQVNPVQEFFAMVSDRDLLLAVLSTAGFGLVGVSSYQAARRALGFEAWQAIHMLTYVSVLASIPHQFSTGLFADNTPQRWYWAALLIVTAFCVLTFRVFLPTVASLQHRLRVTSVVPAGPGAVSITMTGRGLADLDVHAGQFFTFRFLGKGLWWHAHPFSLSAAPTGSQLRITVRDLGEGTSRLQKVRLGTRVAIEGPYGLFSDRSRSTTRGLLLAGAGIGIAPIRAILEETAVAPGATTVLLRASRPEELYLVDEIEALCRAKGANLVLATGHRGPGAASWLPGSWQGVTLDQIAPHVSTSDVYVCGPEPWTDAVVAAARTAGAKPSRIHDERFSW